MNRAPASKRSRTTSRQEAQRLFQTLGDLIDCLLNKVFALTQKAANQRATLLTILLLAAGFFFSLSAFPLNQWLDLLRSFFIAIFNPGSRPANTSDPVIALFTLAFKALISPNTLRYLPLILLPYYLALQLASIYLDDIFELNHVETARDFILRAALGSSYATLRIKQGDIAKEHEDSPIYKIGGPGNVMVELDSVALFEHPDGRPHIVGPTGDKPHGVETLEGFERFRQALYLPDHFPEPIEVTERSSDGLLIEAQDVRLVFSIWRGDNEKNRKPRSARPYPFETQAVKNIVYGETREVSKEKIKQTGSEKERAWSNSVKALIRSELRNFMSRYQLGEYLASINEPEVQSINELQEKLKINQNQVPLKKPAFHPRPEITNLFNTFADDFTKKAKNRGLELHWIGVGTWHTPEQIIPKRHLEAWRISRDNLVAKSEGAIKEIRDQASLQAILDSINEVPLEIYRTAQQKRLNDAMTLRNLLLAYRGQLSDSRDKIRENGEKVPDWMNTIIDHIDDIAMYNIHPPDDPLSNAAG